MAHATNLRFVSRQIHADRRRLPNHDGCSSCWVYEWRDDLGVMCRVHPANFHDPSVAEVGWDGSVRWEGVTYDAVALPGGVHENYLLLVPRD